MKKSGTNAHWNKLPASGRKTLDNWLFEENLSFREILPRAREELGFTGGLTSLKRYYRRRRQERLVEELREVAEYMAGVSGAPADMNALRLANLRLLGRRLFLAMSEGPEELQKLAPLASMLVQNDHNEALRELKGEVNRIRRERLEFAKEKFQFDAMRKALRALPQLQELAKAMKDPHTKRYEENAYWNALRRSLFGNGIDAHPESAAEEAIMIAAKRERAAELEREQIVDAQPPVPGSPYYQEYMAEKAKQEKEQGGELKHETSNIQPA